jgi:formate hydrogenlyase subunit 3/multisubunit Na+/H+ antiporter MnhD subunit
MASTETSLLPVLILLAPVATALVVVATRRRANVRDAALVVGAVVTFLLVASLVPRVLAGEAPATRLVELLPGAALTLRMDGMALVFALLAAFLWVLASPYAIGYLRGDDAKNQTRFMAFYALCLSTAFGVAMAADLLTFFIFYELLTVATYPLVTHKGDEKAIAAGRRYLGYLISGGALVLLGTTIVYQQTGELAFRAGGFVGDAMSGTLVAVAFLLFAVGFGTKAGLMPLHAWLPSAMVAPTPVSALLHAVAVVKAGVFAFGRLIGFVFGPDVLAGVGIHHVLSVAAATTIVVASVIALRQDHLKRRLAYSTIAHLAYIVLGFSLLSQTAFEGSLLHIVNHGALKITLFFAAGALHVHLHLDHVSELDGVGRRMPLTMGAFALASLGLAGLPLMGGFLSKWHLVLGAYEGGSTWAALVMTGAGLLTAGYLFPIVHRAFFRPAPDRAPAHAHVGHDDGGDDHGVPHAGAHAEVAAPGGWRDADPRMVVPLVVTATLGLALGLGDLFGVYALADLVATAVFGGAG